MSRTTPLDVIRVKTPCHESWDAMTGDAKTRFCSGCQRHVHNLSAMPREEAERLLWRAGVGPEGLVPSPDALSHILVLGRARRVRNRSLELVRDRGLDRGRPPGDDRPRRLPHQGPVRLTALRTAAAAPGRQVLASPFVDGAKLTPSLLGVVAVSGVLDTTANVLFLYAVREGLLALGSVISAMYPASTLLLAGVNQGPTWGWGSPASVAMTGTGNRSVFFRSRVPSGPRRG